MIVHAQTKRTFLSLLTRFSRNHPVVLFVALLGCFLLVPSEGFVYAQTTSKVFPDWFSLNNLLYVFFEFFAWLVQLAARIFLWVVDVKAFSKLMNDGSIYIVWRTVRDFCNIFFILVLLFSAFATIFQLEKYEWKKTLPMLILMALLVNFSFPISRFVIDLANVPMYFFAQNTFGESINSISSSYLGNSGMKDIILPKVPEGTGTDHYEAIEKFSLTHLLAAIVCMFLFGISFLVLALLMLVRMIALAILVMFSPIGFVGLITPALHKFASDWWDKLFKWAFYGPIAMMLVLVAIVVMRAAKTNIDVQNVTGLTGNSVNDSVIASVAFFAIPIVLFWIAITQAEKYSNDMSGLGIKFGSNMGRKVGGWVRKGAWGAAMYIPKQTGIAGGIKQAWQDRMSGFKDSREKRERAAAGVFGGDRARARIDQENKKLVDEASKKKTMVDLSPDELKKIVTSGTKYEKVAALTELAGRGLATRSDLNDVRKLFGVDSQVTRSFEAKMRAFDPVSVFTDINGKLNTGRLESFAGSGQVDWKKISDTSLTPELLQYAFKAKTISNKDLDDLRSKGTEYTNAIKKNLDVAIESMDKENSGKWDLTNDIQRNIQSAYLAQTGKFHATMERTPDSSFMKTDSSGVVSASSRVEAKGDLLARADANVLKRMDKSLIDSSPAGIQNLTVLMGRMSAGKYAEIITEMEKSGVAQAAVAKDMNDYIRSLTGATGNAARLKGVADKDHRLAHLR